MTYLCSKFIAINLVLFLREENKRSIVMDRDITHYRDGEMEQQIHGLDEGLQISWLLSDKDGELCVD